MENPKVFISYSWHPKENQMRVLELANRLSSDGVHVVLDVWDLKDGQDKNKYMEQMVNDPTVSKVLLICNSDYVAKANERKGGVGIESTIVSEEIYSHADQTKFIPIVFERLEGKDCVPTFAKSRIYIDLSVEENFETNYDQLLRDIYDKPRFQRPPIGRMPSYLQQDEPVYLPTANKVKAISNAIYSNSKFTSLLIQDYIDLFIDSLKLYKIEANELSDDNFIDKIVGSIDSMLPLRDDFIDFTKLLVRTQDNAADVLFSTFERMAQFYEDEEITLAGGANLGSMAFDNYRYFNYDLFVSVSALLIKEERFSILNDIVRRHYCIMTDNRAVRMREISYMRFRSYNYTLNRYKNNRDGSRRLSVVADEVKRNSKSINFKDKVNADILLYYLSLMYPGNDYYENYWYPELSVYNNYVEVLPKLASKRFFEKAKALFEVKTVEEFKTKITGYKEPDIRDGYRRVPNMKVGLSYESVCTMN